jgi:hypothetical protein
MGLKLNATYQLLVYAEDLNLSRDNTDTIKNRKTLIDASKKVGLGENAQKTKYITVSSSQSQ